MEHTQHQHGRNNHVCYESEDTVDHMRFLSKPCSYYLSIKKSESLSNFWNLLHFLVMIPFNEYSNHY